MSCVTAKDRALVEGLERLELAKGTFHHEEHVRVAWVMLQDAPLAEVTPRFVAALQRFARANDAPDLYHETITLSFLFAINERVQQASAGETWTEFKRCNPDLLGDFRKFLSRYYSDERLNSKLARREYLLPDRLIESTEDGDAQI